MMERISDIAEGIKAAMEKAYRSEQRRLFYPSQFAQSTSGDIDEVLRALRELLAHGYITCEAEFVCPRSHDFKRLDNCGPTFDPGAHFSAGTIECPYCGREYRPRDIQVKLIFVISPAWEEPLQPKKKRVGRRPLP